MKKFLRVLKWTGIVLGSILLVLVVIVLILSKRTFDAPFPNITAVNDSAVIARGKYLAFGPAHCSGCHSPAENLARLNQGEELPLVGGHDFALPIGHMYSANLTPDKETGIGNLTDQQIARALRYGVGHDGRALFDFMPFHNLSDDDLRAVISFIRSQPPIKHKVPGNDLNFIGKAVKAFLLKPVGPSETIQASVTIDTSADYGKYLVNNVANCKGCHTNRNLFTGAYTGPELAGGLKFESETDPGTYTVTPNLTPDKETGRIANWTQEQFIKRIKQGKIIPASAMPWEQFQHMNDNDLKAIFNYLHSVKPVKNDVGPTYVNGGAGSK
jgi:mono/diheme cytochrome c family protein